MVFEDVGEAPYRIERMLTHWRLCGALQQLAGIGFGSFEGWREADGRAEEPADHRFDLEQVLRERSLDLGIPVVAHLPVGHSPGNAALPLGVRARLDGDADTWGCWIPPRAEAQVTSPATTGSQLSTEDRSPLAAGCRRLAAAVAATAVWSVGVAVARCSAIPPD